jgi:hypothetical protein
VSTEAIDTPPMTEAEQVEAWRLTCLLRAGWPLEMAETLAATPDVDLRQACETISKHNCPPDVAFAIFA